MKLVHIVEGFSGGTSTYISTVLPKLAAEGFDVTLISSTDRCCPDVEVRLSELKNNGITVHLIPMYRQINPLRDTQSLAVILRLLKQNNFDIIHTHCSKAGALGRVAGLLTGTKARLHTPHCFAFTRCSGRSRRQLYLTLEKILGKLTTRIIAVAPSEVSLAMKKRIVPAERCTLVRNGLYNGQFPVSLTSTRKDTSCKATLGLDKETKVVTTACRLVEYKGIFRFLEAASLSRTHNTVFLIAGDGKLKSSAEEFIERKNLRHKVRLLGHICDMKKIYDITDVVALCSDAEAQPYTLLEAMRAGCPIVATRVIGSKELISNNETGILVEPESVSIAGAIDDILTDNSKRNRLARNAYEYFHKNHTLDRQISELVEVYRTVCKG